MDKIFHTAISVSTVCGSGSEKYGATATTTASYDQNKKFFEVNMKGKTKEEAKSKLKRFLSDNGTMELVEVQS